MTKTKVPRQYRQPETGTPDGREHPRRTHLGAELSAVVRLATPVTLTHLGMMLMGTVDVMMLGRVSEQALAAGALGNRGVFAKYFLRREAWSENVNKKERNPWVKRYSELSSRWRVGTM